MSKQQFYDMCSTALESKKLHEDLRYIKRFRWEVDEIIGKEKQGYFINLVETKTRYPKNQNNLLVCWLLGIAPDFDIDKEPASVFTGDLPDIDIDYLPVVRDYLKNKWAIETFGSDHVCNIGNYTTFGIKSALIDMARVNDAARDEVMAITKNLEDKDEEGKLMTWDAAMRMHPELQEYAKKYSEVADAAKRMLNRNRGMGVHAGGLIIANIPLHDLVPLVKRKDSPQASAWPEGMHGQELGPVGLVKFDLLVISNLLQIARCCELVKNRRGVEGVCNKPGESDWTDVSSWRNDQAAIEMANSGDLKCIFQFDSEGMRSLVKSGGVDRFEDLVAYSALFRPGPLNSKMTARYVERKKGREQYSIHPLMRPILEKTYGILCYQEQIMSILNIVGDIPLKDCETIRKAISKKRIESFIKYKEMFIINGQNKLGMNENEIKDLWGQIETFAEYGFNKSHAVAYTYISMYLLYLKSHFPPEFYTAMLSCESTSEKIKDIKMEAKIHGVDMHRLDINKSSDNFSLIGDTIYYGFSNVRGIGEGPAKRIVHNQPYLSFEDFLLRFGTDASVLKPILGLRCFRDRDPITLWKFADYFKEKCKKMAERRKRHEAALEKYEQELRVLLPEAGFKLSDLSGDKPFDKPQYHGLDYDQMVTVEKEVPCAPGDGGYPRVETETVEVPGADALIEREIQKWFKKIKATKQYNRYKELNKLWAKRAKSIERFKVAALDQLPKLVEFNPDEYDAPDAIVKELRDPIVCEEQFYGFAWIHELERSPDYRGNLTFSALKNTMNDAPGPVEIKIKRCAKTESKKGNTYYQVIAEDATGQENKINVWPDDMARWSAEFQPGNLLRVRLQPPSGGFNTYLLESNQQGKFRGKLRFKNKEDDVRVFPMRFGVKEEEKFLTDEEVLAQFDNCNME
jgi:DNA polymerase III alpha subunit